ncbi:helix-turn-helix domain-containing protein [Micromonospora craniellae]|uniref:XRE family transcriptional regulator n=1 Tax=Micromonospora craniellae TaxID=2294034 RepID=A0A372FWY8_9ACTN|nr:helix-turn-helix transcriptional regulator [Micromonospora craniellae]QOC90117.1 helix-turn-helix transcriptional regulator [Micromonospora craniellae]RFS45311.1 XRE family transcriptional regulator [Micromonospora craniellae]
MSDIPNPVATFIVGEIRRARGRSGMTQEAFGRSAGFSASHVSAVEGGTRALTSDFIRGADRALNNGGLFERLATKLGAPSWFLPWLDAERSATQLRYFEPNLIPGLLQVEHYARAVLRTVDSLTDDEVEQRVKGRMDRQAILTSERPPQFVAVLDEAALRRTGDDLGGIMAQQIAHLIALTELPHVHVHVHVIPLGSGLHVGLSGPFALARSAEGVWVGHLENQLGGDVVDKDDDVATLQARWESVRNEALPRRQSINLLKEVESHHGPQ